MKKLFVAIRRHDNETVKELLKKKPELIHCVAKKPPIKDNGQSPLQVSIKTGNYEIANLLIDMGADINFIEANDASDWRAPVLHDSIIAAVMTARWNTNTMRFEVHSTKKKADAAYALLKRLLEAGADIHVLDSYDTSCLERAISQARQILPTYSHVEKKLLDDRILTKELHHDLTRIFQLLLQYGADSDALNPRMGMSYKEYFKDEPVLQFLIPEEKKGWFASIFRVKK